MPDFSPFSQKFVGWDILSTFLILYETRQNKCKQMFRIDGLSLTKFIISNFIKGEAEPVISHNRNLGFVFFCEYLNFCCTIYVRLHPSSFVLTGVIWAGSTLGIPCSSFSTLLFLFFCFTKYFFEKCSLSWTLENYKINNKVFLQIEKLTKFPMGFEHGTSLFIDYLHIH